MIRSLPLLVLGFRLGILAASWVLASVNFRTVDGRHFGALHGAYVLVDLAARGGSGPSHRGGRGARLARRDELEYREYSSEEQRRQTGCSVRRMQADFHHGLPGKAVLLAALAWRVGAGVPS